MGCEIREYTVGGKSFFGQWFNSLDPAAAARVDRYIRRAQTGNFGNTKAVGEGVRELKINFGPGDRVYYGREGDTIVILLGGGSKRRQSADITVAKERWKQYKAGR